MLWLHMPQCSRPIYHAQCRPPEHPNVPNPIYPNAHKCTWYTPISRILRWLISPSEALRFQRPLHQSPHSTERKITPETRHKPTPGPIAASHILRSHHRMSTRSSVLTRTLNLRIKDLGCEFLLQLLYLLEKKAEVSMGLLTGQGQG